MLLQSSLLQGIGAWVAISSVKGAVLVVAVIVLRRLPDLRGRFIMIASFRIASIRNKCATMLALAAVTSVALIQPGFTSPAAGAQAQAAASTGSVPAEQSQAQLLREQTRPQKEVQFNPVEFDKFAGYYQRQPGLPTFFHIYRNGDRYYSQITGQMPVEIFPESPSEFFATVVAAQVSFDIGPGGQVTGLVLHQGGLLMPWQRVSAAAFEAANAKLQQRIKSNAPSPGTEAALRHQIETLERGDPDYAAMGPGLADATRQQLPQIRALFKKIGALKSLEFGKVLPNGADLYLATFEHGELACTITPLSPDGKVTGDFFHLMP